MVFLSLKDMVIIMNVTDRFLKYVSFHTTSDEESTTVPSTDRQRLLAAYLAEELKSIGLKRTEVDENGYVYGYLPGSGAMKNEDALGLIAHMDTAPDVSGENIRPKIIAYHGGDISLESGEKISVSAFPFLQNYAGQNLIVTDGTTLLGADDKAGVAEIVTLCEQLAAHPEIAHQPIMVCFTPDEEIGRGVDHLNLSKFKVKVAYTVDGGELGEIEYENFNAASARIEIHGMNIHPGSAKNKMKNAVLLATEFINMLPPAETPAHTEGYEGFYHVSDFTGNESRAEIRMIIRDHDRESFEKRKAFVENIGSYLNGVYGDKTFSVTVKDSYYNMKEKILPHMELIENAEKAMEKAGVTPKIVAIRGGTDGARLSFEGIPCPNLSTGGMNFHSIHECISVQAMEKMVEVLENLVK